MSSVLLPWVQKMPWKMQSILISGLRAPDSKTDSTKRICRWMRSICQNNADPSKGYMEPQVLDDKLIEVCMDELEYLPCHYVHHFADALRVVALFYRAEEKPMSDRQELLIRTFAFRVHHEVAVEIFHFKPETDNEFIDRHRDKVWHQ